MVAIQGSLAGIAAGGHQDQSLFGVIQVALGLHQKLGHQLQGIILESTGGAVPQFQRPGVPFHRCKIAGFSAKGGAIGLGCCLGQEGRVVISQVFLEDGCCHSRIFQLADGLSVHLREGLGHKQAALLRQALTMASEEVT